MTNVHIDEWLFAVRSDTDRTAGAVEALLAHYRSADTRRLQSHFGLRAGRRLLQRPAELYIGGTLAARRRSLEAVLHVLVSYIAGLRHVERHSPRVPMRVFVRGTAAVLVDLARPELVDDRALAGAGIMEAHLWEPVIDPVDRSIVAPDALPSLDWTAADMTPPPKAPTRYELAGVVTRSLANGEPDLRGLGGRATGDRGAWLEVLDDLSGRELIRAGDDTRAFRTAVISLLS